MTQLFKLGGRITGMRYGNSRPALVCVRGKYPLGVDHAGSV